MRKKNLINLKELSREVNETNGKGWSLSESLFRVTLFG